MASLSDVNSWLKRVTPHEIKALENASRHLGKNNIFTVHTLEAIYGQESVFGTQLRKVGMAGAASYFHIEKQTAERYIKFKITKNNDPRFNIDDSAVIAIRYLNEIYRAFGKETTLSYNLKTITIQNTSERKLFAIAAYNAGEGSIARAQQEAKNDGKNPEKWDEVKNYLEAAGIKPSKAKEIIDYVKTIIEFEEYLFEKSPSKDVRDKKPIKISENLTEDGRWIIPSLIFT